MADADAYRVRTIDKLLAVHNGGDDGAEATAQHDKIMDRLAQLVAEHGGKHKAKLQVTLDYEADAKGVDITISAKATIPGRPKMSERYFMTRENQLTRMDPGRESLFPGVDMGRRRGPTE